MEYPEQLDQLALQDLLAQVSPDQQEIMVLMDYQELPARLGLV
jgi:DNA-directed RNA polymerase specialized sigma24 family protein